MDPKELREKIIQAGYIAVEQLIKVAKEDIIKPDLSDELAADRLKNAAASKRLAVFDAFEILSRIESEKNILEGNDEGVRKVDTKQGWAERRAK
jgi:hypothetical protein